MYYRILSPKVVLVGGIALMILIIPSSVLGNLLVIDPGHGGTQNGAPTVISGLSEKNINLRVAKVLYDSACQIVTAALTRAYDTTTVSLRERALMANDGNASEFISVHHNSSTDTTVQGTETWFCDSVRVPDTATFPYSGVYRADTTDTLARKTRDMLYRALGYSDRGVKDSNFTVLHYTIMPSSLTEASFISQPREARKFAPESTRHVAIEAGAIYRGYRSFVFHQGFGLVEYRYVNANPLADPTYVKIDNVVNSVPYERCWELHESHELQAMDFQTQGYSYTFHHWEERRHGEGEMMLSAWPPGLRIITVNPQVTYDGYHYYVAYFKGGPFDFGWLSPGWAENYFPPNATVRIRWSAPYPVLPGCSVLVDYSSNGGTTWQTVGGPVAYYNGESESGYAGHFDWRVPSQTATNCRLRLRAFDFVGNFDTVLYKIFEIGCVRPKASFWSLRQSINQWPPTYKFTETSDNFPNAWRWEFGDGLTSTERSPTHKFYSGNYTVRLTATNSCGSDDTVMTNVVQVAPCTSSDPDSDNDGIRNACDNCPGAHNPS